MTDHEIEKLREKLGPGWNKETMSMEFKIRGQEWTDVSATLRGDKSLRWDFKENKLEWVDTIKMTDQEIEKLQEKLGPEYSVKRQNGAITVELEDIWDGVEFAECLADVKVDRYGKEIAKGQIYRIVDWFKREVIYIDDDELGWQSKHFKPSTESAYVEQLKAKAHELYGEIKDGDRFEFTWIGDVIERSIQLKGKYDFYYDKESDALYLYGFPLYKQGKWAKKVEEPIRVEPTVVYLTSSENDEYSYAFRINGANKIPHARASQYLSKCLEDYLNKS